MVRRIKFLSKSVLPDRFYLDYFSVTGQPLALAEFFPI